MKKIAWTLTGHGWLLGVMAILAGIVAGCKTNDEPTFTSVPVLETVGASSDHGSTNTGNSGSEGVFTLNVGDMLKVTLVGPDPSPAPHDERIKEDGTITLDLIGQVPCV